MMTRAWAAFGIVMLLALLLQINNMTSRLMANSAAIHLSHAILASSDETWEGLSGQIETTARKSLEYNPSSSVGVRQLAFALAIQGRQSEALDVIDNSNESQPMSVFAWGNELMRLRRAEEAVKLWRIDGDVGSLFLHLGKSSLADNHLAEALYWFRLLVQMEPDWTDGWYYLALAFEKIGDWDRALENYSQATGTSLSYEVHSSTPHYRIGRIYQWTKKPPQLKNAVAAYEAGLMKNDFTTPEEAFLTRYSRIEALWWTERDSASVIKELEQIVREDPTFAAAHTLLGIVYYVCCDDVTLAEKEMLEAIRLAPNSASAHFWLGDLYQNAHRVQEAIEAYEKALFLDPEYRDAAARLKDISP